MKTFLTNLHFFGDFLGLGFILENLMNNKAQEFTCSFMVSQLISTVFFKGLYYTYAFFRWVIIFLFAGSRTDYHKV